MKNRLLKIQFCFSRTFFIVKKERRNNMTDSKDKKKSVWDIVLKVIIAALSALAGALGANAMNI